MGVPGFPIAWEETPRPDQLSDVCPYALAEIGAYLFGNHYDLVFHEDPTTFGVRALNGNIRIGDIGYSRPVTTPSTVNGLWSLERERARSIHLKK